MSVKKKKSQKQSQSLQVVEQSLFQDNFSDGETKSFANQNSIKNRDNRKKQFNTVAELLSNHSIKESNKYISQEFQAYGCHMATVLGDQAHTSLYIKLAKTYPRALLERALAFVSDAENARSKAKLFMWKLDQLKKKKELSVNKKNSKREKTKILVK
jgi:hypothetical protein